MGYLDIVILVVLALGIARGWSMGFIRQATLFGGLVLAFVLAAMFMDPLGAVLQSEVGFQEGVGSLISFVGILIAVKLATTLLARWLESVIDAIYLGRLNRLLGGIAGALKAVLILSLVFLVMGYAQLPGSTAISESTMYGHIYRILPEVWRFISDPLQH